MISKVWHPSVNAGQARIREFNFVHFNFSTRSFPLGFRDLSSSICNMGSSATALLSGPKIRQVISVKSKRKPVNHWTEDSVSNVPWPDTRNCQLQSWRKIRQLRFLNVELGFAALEHPALFLILTARQFGDSRSYVCLPHNDKWSRSASIKAIMGPGAQSLQVFIGAPWNGLREESPFISVNG